MISLEDTWLAYAREVSALPAETVAVTSARNRVLAAPVHASVDLPRFDQSAMDGYCFRAADTAVASSTAPARLRIAQRLVAGSHGDLLELKAGECARIFTGAALPPGADAVVAQERATRDGEFIVLDTSWPSGRNVRSRGEEQRRGSLVAEAGTRISPGLLAALINAGATQVMVTQQPRICVLTTGDEVRPAGTVLADGEIPDSNGPLIEAVLGHRGLSPFAVVHVRDDAAAVDAAMTQALAVADLVITAGGASVGERDFIVSAAQACGLRQVFWKVAQKPGKPMLFAVSDGREHRSLLLGLPGNPGAVLACLILHATYILDRLQGLADPGPDWSAGQLTKAVARDQRRARLLRMRLQHDAHGVAQLHPLPHQDSHMLGNLARADVLVWIPAGPSPAEAGEVLQWTRLPA